MSILSDNALVKQKKRFDAVIKVMAYNIVDGHLTNTNALPTPAEVNGMIKDEETELRILFKTNKTEFNNYLNSYFHTVKGKHIATLAPDMQDLLIEEGAVTSGGKISAGAARAVKSGLGKLHVRASASQLGIDIKPSTARTGILDTFKSRYYDPNTPKTTAENKQLVLDKRGFAEDDKYRALILSEEKRILDKKHLATEEEIRLLKAIKETKVQWDKKVMSNERFRASLSPAGKGLDDVLTVAKSGLSSIMKFLLTPKQPKNVQAVENPPVVAPTPTPVVAPTPVPPKNNITTKESELPLMATPKYRQPQKSNIKIEEKNLAANDSVFEEEKDESADELIESTKEAAKKNYEILVQIDEDIKNLKGTGEESSLIDTISAGISGALASKLLPALKSIVGSIARIAVPAALIAGAGAAGYAAGTSILKSIGELDENGNIAGDSVIGKVTSFLSGADTDAENAAKPVPMDLEHISTARLIQLNKSRVAQGKDELYRDEASQKKWDAERAAMRAARAAAAKKLETQPKNTAEELDKQSTIIEKNKNTAKAQEVAAAVGSAITQSNQQTIQNISTVANDNNRQKDSPRNQDNSISLFLKTRAKFA